MSPAASRKISGVDLSSPRIRETPPGNDAGKAMDATGRVQSPGNDAAIATMLAACESAGGYSDL